MSPKMYASGKRSVPPSNVNMKKSSILTLAILEIRRTATKIPVIICKNLNSILLIILLIII
jgi:hypothetical protein